MYYSNVTQQAVCSVSVLVGEGAHNLELLLVGLEATVTKLGGGIDELNLNLFGHPLLSAGEDRLADNDGALTDTHDTTLDEEEILVDFTVMRETTHGGDVLLNSIVGGHGIVGNTTDSTGTDTVDLLVELSTGMVTHLTGAANRPLDGSGMPGTNATDLTETSMGLTGKTVDVVTLDDTLGTVTLW